MQLLDSVQSLHDSKNFKDSKKILDEIKATQLESYDRLRFDYEIERYQINNNIDTENSYEDFQVIKMALPKDSLRLRFRVNDEMIYVYNAQASGQGIESLHNENCSIANQLNNPKFKIICNYYKFYSLGKFTENKNDALNILKENIKIAKENNLERTMVSMQSNLAIVYDQNEMIDSAMVYYIKVLTKLKEYKDQYGIRDLYNNMGLAFYRNEQMDSAIYYMKESVKLNSILGNKYNEDLQRENLGLAFYKNDDYKSSAENFYKARMIRDSLGEDDNADKILELETKYQTAEKDLQIAEQETKNQKLRNQTILLSAFALLLLLAGAFIYNNQNKKRKIAQRDQLLAQERADNLFKEQELATIDAMIAGQEKERKRLSEDLHDNLGSNLTTLKLYVENLKDSVEGSKEQEMIAHSELILKDTYENIRRLSHARHNGLLTSQGLIPAVQELAERINKSKKLNIEVLNFGLDQQLENTRELLIFRVIQELTTNVVKHSEATEASINITSHEDSLNIIVEDNGKGFTANPMPRGTGMGLSSIEKRIEAAGGTFHVDSSKGNGSTVTIDIPLI